MATSAVRLGLPRGVEVQAAFDGWTHRTRRTSRYEGLTDLSSALKATLIRDSEGATISALSGIRLPTGSTEFRAEQPRPRLRVVSSTLLGPRVALHLDVIAERRLDAWSGMAAEGPMAGSAATRPAAILLERQLAVEVSQNASAGGHVGVYCRRDPHLPDSAILGLGLGGRWYATSGVVGELAAGFGVLDRPDRAVPEWFVGLGLGYSSRR